MKAEQKDGIQIGSVYLDKYKIIKVLGTGGMNSIVYYAQNLNYLETEPTEKFKEVAIKVIFKTEDISYDSWAKILDERVTIGRLIDSPYIVSLELYFPSKYDKDKIIFSMEYINGPSLSELIKKRGSLSVVEALSIFKKIVLGVNYMHKRERIIIHRDLKPENILLSKDLLDVKISDFGVASVIQNIDGENYSILSNEKDIFGTIPYISPDVFDSNPRKRISKQLDFHSLGIIFYEMLTGNKPLDIENEKDPNVIKLFLNHDIIPFKKISSDFVNELENIFLKLTASKKSDIKYRYDDCYQIIEDILKVEEVINKKKESENLIIPIENRNFQNIFTFKINENITMANEIQNNKLIKISILSFFVILILFVVFFIFKYAG